MKFAHIADSHIGAFSKNPELAECNIRAFEESLKICISENVDFVLIAGDLFHNPVPNMAMAERAVSAMKRVRDAGIPIYVVYGSHDFSAGTTSLIDILASAGVFTKAVQYDVVDGKIVLKPVRDEKTGVSIVGVTGLTASREVEYFEEGLIDIASLESIPSPKVFVFHTTVEEVKPGYIKETKAVPVHQFPKGFDYYAGGHLHEKVEYSYSGAPLIYPGALFGATYNDLDEEMKRGFYIVEDFKPKFVEVHICDIEKKIFKADGKSARELEREIDEYAARDHGGRVLIIKVRGELASGRAGEIDFGRIRQIARETAREVLLNTYSLSSAEYEASKVSVSSEEDIEEKMFREISDYGLDFTKRLFAVLRDDIKDGEKKGDFEKRIWDNAKSLIDELILSEKFPNSEVRNSDGDSGDEDGVTGVEEDELRTNISRPNESREARKKASTKTLFEFGDAR